MENTRVDESMNVHAEDSNLWARYCPRIANPSPRQQSIQYFWRHEVQPGRISLRRDVIQPQITAQRTPTAGLTMLLKSQTSDRRPPET
jgi:hypothetical protein